MSEAQTFKDPRDPRDARIASLEESCHELRRNLRDAGQIHEDLRTKLRAAEERAESYSDVLRGLASWLGAGGFNAPDPIDAEMYDAKIRWGVENAIKDQRALDAHIAAKPTASTDAGLTPARADSVEDGALADDVSKICTARAGGILGGLPFEIVLRIGAVLLVAFVAGCRPPPVRTALESRAMHVAREAWTEMLGKPRGSCSMERFDVVHARDDGDFRRWCYAPSCSGASCLNHVWYKVVLRPGQELEPDGEPVIHEALHMFILCETSGTDADAGHTRRDVWKANGPGTVQERAEKLYRGGP